MHFLFNLEAEENRKTGQISVQPEVHLLVTQIWNDIWRTLEQKESAKKKRKEKKLFKEYIEQYGNETLENFPDELLIQTGMVRTQLLI